VSHSSFGLLLHALPNSPRILTAGLQARISRRSIFRHIVRLHTAAGIHSHTLCTWKLSGKTIASTGLVESVPLFYRKLKNVDQANSASYHQRDGKWVPAKVWWCSAAGSKGRHGSLHFSTCMWINLWVAGKTVWSLV